ncbi:Venom allergen 3 [Blattella germanica]|nr:Venom allergen 3 [Blattella germanica]
MGNMELTSLLAFLVVVCAVTVEANNNYCSLCKDHTLCKYPQFGPNCNARKASGVDEASQKVIVDVHNKLRSTVANGKENRGKPGPQPPASNMRALTWDSELASIAQRWANQCDFGHDKCRNVQRFKVGQNVFMSFSSGSNQNYSPEWENAINGWYNEVDKYNKNEVQSYKFNSQTGHYTQVVWADTSKVGCGYTAFRSANGGTVNKYYVCNYGKAGNWIGETMYKKGKACSMCPNGTSCNAHGLCK